MTDDTLDRLRELRDQMTPEPELLAELTAKIDAANLPVRAGDPASPDTSATHDSPLENSHSIKVRPSTPKPGTATPRTPSTTQSRPWSNRLLASVMSIAVIGSLGVAAGTSIGSLDAPLADTPLASATGYEQVYTALKSTLIPIVYSSAPGAGMDVPMAVDEAGSAPDLTTQNVDGAGGESTANFSGTNTQVVGIDEGDVVKTDGEYLYIAKNSANDVRTVSVLEASGSETRLVSTIDLNETKAPDETALFVLDMMLDGSTLMVFTHGYTRDTNSTEPTTLPADAASDSMLVGYEADRLNVAFYDIEDATNPTYLSTLSQSGSYSTSRLLDGVLYLVSSYYVHPGGVRPDDPSTYVPQTGADGDTAPCSPEDVHILPDIASSTYSVVTAIRATDHVLLSELAVLGGSDTVYMSDSNLYLSGGSWNVASEDDTTTVVPSTIPFNGSHTTLVRIGLDSETLDVSAEGAVPGYLHNQFSLDEYDSHVRVVTDYSGASDSTSWTTNAGLWILDQSLTVVGSVPSLVEGETVQSVRFDGTVAYVVTFEQTDPLFTIDISNPTSPQVRSALKIPGFSTYLHPWTDGQLLGLGVNGDDTGVTSGLKLSMFDVSDPFAVSESSTAVIAAHFSEGLHDHKAVFVDPGRGLIGIPAWIHGSGAEEYSYLMYSWDGTQFTLRSTLDVSISTDQYGNPYSNSSAIRGVRIDDTFYIATQSGVSAYDMEGYSQLVQVELA